MDNTLLISIMGVIILLSICALATFFVLFVRYQRRQNDLLRRDVSELERDINSGMLPVLKDLVMATQKNENVLSEILKDQELQKTILFLEAKRRRNRELTSSEDENDGEEL